jgi:hypothetical protein
MNSFKHLQKQPSIVYGDAAYLLQYRFTDGGGFPPSYLDFALQVGWGRLCNLFLVYIPAPGYADSWPVQSARIKGFMDIFYQEMEYDPFLLEPDGYPGLESALVPFGMSENGEYLAWDNSQRNSANKFPIYVLAARMGGIRYGASNLYDFLAKCTNDQEVKSVLGAGYSGLAPVFEPLRLA